MLIFVNSSSSDFGGKWKQMPLKNWFCNIIRGAYCIEFYVDYVQYRGQSYVTVFLQSIR